MLSMKSRTKRISPGVQSLNQNLGDSGLMDDTFNFSTIDAPLSIDSQVNAIRSLSSSVIKPNSNAKLRILSLEEATQSQTKINEHTASALAQLYTTVIGREESLQAVVSQIKESYIHEIMALRKEFSHKFDLQRAENKRLEESLSTLRVESTQTIRKLNLIIEQLSNLQTEFGDFDESDEFGLMARETIKNKSNHKTVSIPLGSPLSRNVN